MESQPTFANILSKSTVFFFSLVTFNSEVAIKSKISRVGLKTFLPKQDTIYTIDDTCKVIKNSAHDNINKPGIFSIPIAITQAKGITDICSVILR